MDSIFSLETGAVKDYCFTSALAGVLFDSIPSALDLSGASCGPLGHELRYPQ